METSKEELQEGFDASNPEALTDYVTKMLDQIQSKFEEMSGGIMSKMDEMGSKIEELEKSISDLLEQTTAEESNPPAKST